MTSLAAIDFASAALGVLFGSIPFGLIIGRLFYGVDLRSHGSGNIGAANALRTIGKTGAAAVLLLDAAKGAVPPLLASLWCAHHAPAFAGSAEYAAGAGALLGHCFTPWLRFRGGKGVATSLGVLLVLAWPAGLAGLAVYAAVAKATRVSAIGSLSGAVAGAVGLAILKGPAGAAYGAASVLLLFYTHRSNIARLRSGDELALQAKVPPF